MPDRQGPGTELPVVRTEVDEILPQLPARDYLANTVDLKVLDSGIVVITPLRQSGLGRGNLYPELRTVLIELPLETKTLLNLGRLGDELEFSGERQLLGLIMHRIARSGEDRFRMIGVPKDLQSKLKALGFPRLPKAANEASGIKKLAGGSIEIDAAATERLIAKLNDKIRQVLPHVPRVIII